MEICSAVIATGGAYGSIVKVALPRDDVTNTFSLGYTICGEPVHKGPIHFPDTRDDLAFGIQWIQYAEELLQEGRITTVPLQVGFSLDEVLNGVDLLRQGKVSAKKLVYKIN